MLLDSNIVIYRSKGFPIEEILGDGAVFASIITKVEVLGFTKLLKEEIKEFELFFNEIIILPVTDEIANLAIKLKQMKKISLPDSIIAATALLHKLPLVTANVDDFKWIKELKIINPLL